MTLHLREGVHVALLDEDVVILDVARDAYLCVPGGACGFAGPPGMHRLLPGPLTLRLEAAGLTATAPPTPRRSLPARPVRSIIHQERTSSIGARDVWPALGALGALRAAQRRSGLGPHLDIVRDDTRLTHDPDRVLTAARQFWDLAVWLPFRGECLQRSALLVAWLQKRGLRADWVFGVRLWPFSAHCWVQCDNVCLNDDFERLRAFTPILCR